MTYMRMHFMRHFGAVFCHYLHDRVQRDIIRLIKADLSYLKQHEQNIIFLIFGVNFRQLVTKYYGNFKNSV